MKTSTLFAVAILLQGCGGKSDAETGQTPAGDTGDTAPESEDSASPGDPPDSGGVDTAEGGEDSGPPVDTGTAVDTGAGGDTGGAVDTGAGVDTGDPGGESGHDVTCLDPEVVPADASLCQEGMAAVLDDSTAYGTVQEAIGDASSGSVITVCPGTWSESLTIEEESVALVGYGAGISKLSGEGEERVLWLGEGLSLSVADLTVAEGMDDEIDDYTIQGGGGLRAGENTEVCITRAVFEENSSYSNAGAIQVDANGTLTVVDSDFTANISRNMSGAIYVKEGSTVAMGGAVFTENQASYGAGAAYFDDSGTVTIVDSSFRDNEAGYHAGAVHFGGSTGGGVLSLTRTDFEGNIAEHEGGALGIGDWADPSVYVYECTFTSNEALAEGGAVLLGSWSSGYFYAEDTLFEGNGAEDGGALAMNGWGDHAATLVDCSVEGNQAEDGGAFSLDNKGTTLLEVQGGSVLANTASDDGGGALLDPETAELYVVSSDWGSGATENTPEDVDIGHSYSFGTGSFSCYGGACY